ncbi:hypothetical protein [Kitasatospora sp. GAS204B]|uniref:helix-turn-helix transcriptional regulator n=1 Tax=unclassified Kitasatospora TaxID=2633591 RepID=UPI002474CB71|nr:hypothetical protein [Kitasatospora sp. GAS204B]MDH6118590.1 DNA-binding CsgD family transcriptional regulator [Kitasatospora sp. GAS204B]
MTSLDFGGPSDLDELHAVVYQHVMETRELDVASLTAALGCGKEQVEQARDTLVELQLIVLSSPEDGRWTVVSPDVAKARVVDPLENKIRHQAALAERMRQQIHALVPVHDAYRRKESRGQAIDIVSDLTVVNLLLNAESDKCAREVLTLQPGGGRSPERLALALERDRAMLARGVRIRTVYQHAARYDLPTQGYVETLTRAGGEFRSVDEVPDRLVIFDRSTCFVPIRPLCERGELSADDPGRGEAAAIIRDPQVTAFMVRLFSVLWDQAQPFDPTFPQPKFITDHQRRMILRLMATGAKDEVVARRLGMSVRTCRRHISDLTQALGAESRFQAGVIAARLGLLAAPEETGPEEGGPKATGLSTAGA